MRQIVLLILIQNGGVGGEGMIASFEKALLYCFKVCFCDNVSSNRD